MSIALADSSDQSSALRRYLQLAVIVIAVGAIYPLIYLRQNFEIFLLESFGITISELSQCYASLGVIFVLTYVPSGWHRGGVDRAVRLPRGCGGSQHRHGLYRR